MRGEGFLPGIGIDKLKALRRKDTDAKATDMLLVYVYRKATGNGKRIVEAILKKMIDLSGLHYAVPWHDKILLLEDVAGIHL